MTPRARPPSLALRAARCPPRPGRTQRSGHGRSHGGLFSPLMSPFSSPGETQNVLHRSYDRVFQALYNNPINAHVTRALRQVGSAARSGPPGPRLPPCSWPDPSGSTPSSSAGLSRPHSWRVPVLTRGGLSHSAVTGGWPLLRSPRPPTPTVHPESTQSRHAPTSLRGGSSQGTGPRLLPSPRLVQKLSPQPSGPEHLMGDPVVKGVPPQTGAWLGDTISRLGDNILILASL